MIFKKISIFIFSIIGLFANAQKVLSIEDAIAIALKSNYDIRISQNNDVAVSKNNNTLGNAGMLPTLTANGSDNYSMNNSKQKSQTGAESSFPNQNVNALNFNAVLNWTVFDGGKMFVTKNKLAQIQALGELKFKDKVQSTIFSVISAYYDIVKQQQQLASINETIKYNEERVRISQTSFESGLSPKTELLQAKMDLNIYTQNAINQNVAIENAKRTLIQLLSLSADSSISVKDTIPLNYTPNTDELFTKLLNTNTSILSSKKQIDIDNLSLKEYKKSLFPTINLTSGYYYSKTDYSEGTNKYTQTQGPQFGGTISIPIFQAGNQMRQITNAKIQLESSEFSLEKAKLQVKSDLLNALNDFDNQHKLLEIEIANVQLSKENIEICLQRLRYGQATSLELSKAQESYVASCTRLINFKYNLKIAEIKLKKLIAEL